MEVTQRDRDGLRQAQYKMHSSKPFNIGNIVEHKVQDPASYRAKSRQEQGLSADVTPLLPKIDYKSLYLDKKETSQPSQATSRHIDTNQEVTTNETMTTMPIIVEEERTLMNLPITPSDVQANYWLNMDRVEFEKLEWMSDKADKEYKRKFKASIHFDGNGRAVSSSVDLDNQQGEAHDISSLVNFLSSSFQPQVTYALNVISKIATHATIGLYDAVFDENIHQILIKESLLRVRHQMDSPNETICQAAMKCLRSLLCNTQVDEIFLDKLSPLKTGESDVTMWLSSAEGNFDIGMRDNDCVHSDAILGLIVRTDILTRFKYLLNTKVDVKFRDTYYDCTLDLLIRMARHSREICWILNNEGFPQVLIDRCLLPDIARKDRLQQSFALRSLKFIRIISSAAHELNSGGSDKDEPVIKLPTTIVPIISAYYYSDCFTDEGASDIAVQIQIETLRLMNSLYILTEFSKHIFSIITLEQNSLVQHVRSLTNLDALKPISSPSSLDWQYAASLINLLGRMMKHERLKTATAIIQSLWSSFIRQITLQWFNDIIRERVIPHQDVSIALHVAASTLLDSNDEVSISDFYKVVLKTEEILATERERDFDPGKRLSKTSRHPAKRVAPNQRINKSAAYFRFLLHEAMERSQLNAFLKNSGRRRDPVMLNSFGFVNFNTSKHYTYRLNSFIETNTPYILLSLYLTLLQKCCSKFDNVLSYYFNDENLTRYAQFNSCYHKFPLNYESEVQRSLLCQMEVRILANAFLLLSEYYNQVGCDNNTESDVTRDGVLAVMEKGCYSQFILHVISLICLINPEVGPMLTIKDDLLTKVVLNESLQSRLVTESYLSNDELLRNMKFDQLRGHKYNGSMSDRSSLSEKDLETLKAIYLSCEQPGRFWIFQPLMEYYFCQIHESDGTKRVKDGKWFLKNISKNLCGKLLPTDCSDLDTITLILKMNSSLMYRSPSYLKIMVKENIEEYLCMIGSIFLDDDLFLEEKMSFAIWHNLEIILSAGLLLGVDRLFVDASQTISCLKLPLIDFFNKLIDQYEAASYNDIAFTNFLLLFLSPKSDKIFRKKLFTDKLETCLSQVRISLSDVWLPNELMFKIKEEDPEIKSLIRRSRAYINKSTYLDYYILHHIS